MTTPRSAARRTPPVRLVCPVNPEHGTVLDWPTSKWSFYCGHHDHDGWGEDKPPTRTFFTAKEVEEGRLDDRE